MRRVLFFFTICLTVMAGKGYVKLVSNGVQLTCPGHSTVSWHGNDIVQNEENKTIILEDAEGLLYCNYDKNQTYYFYIEEIVCKKCFKVSGTLVIAIIVGDLLMTSGVMLITYIWGQRKLRASAVASAQPGAQGPTSSSCEYEDLDSRTRDNALYSVSGVHRIG